MAKSKLTLLALLLGFTISCGQQRSSWDLKSNANDSKIINGEPVSEQDAIYYMTARILELSDGVWYPRCTASIISADLILTAAHCVKGTKADNIRIGFGVQPLSPDLQSNPQTRVDVVEKFETLPIYGYVIHPKHDPPTLNHDMALIRLPVPVPSKYFAVPLLPQSEIEKLKEDQDYNILLAGYGLTQELPEIKSEILRQTEVSGRFKGIQMITDQTKGTGGCRGDSGGPAYLKIDDKLYLVGVTAGVAGSYTDCAHQGLWGNPSFEKDFLNQSATKLKSSTRF